MGEEEFNELRPSAFAIAYRMLGSVSEAEDVVQEGSLRPHRARAGGERIESPRAYLSTVVSRLWRQVDRQPRQADAPRTGGRFPIVPEVGEMNSRATASSLFIQARHPRSQSERPLPVRIAYAALAWVVVFFAFHVYWYLGGTFAAPFTSGQLPGLVPDSVAGWIFAMLEGPAWPLGAWVCLAIARGWLHGKMQRAAAIVVWLACTVLVLRGGAGLIDDLTRATGLLPNGISGISTKSATGMTHVTVSYWAIETYFLAGGIIFGLLAWRYRPSSAFAARDPI